MTSPSSVPSSGPAPSPSPAAPHGPGRSGPVCVLGLGLIGGSLLRDLTAAGIPAFGWNRSPETVTAASDEGYDVSGDLPATLARAEREDALVVLGVPVPALPDMLAAVARHAPSCGITDVTSVKGEVLRLVGRYGLSGRFVGGHPMAGTADSGWDATTEGLFRDAVWVVTTDGAAGEDATGYTAGESTGESAGGPAPADVEPWLRVWRRVIDMAVTVGAAVIPARARKHDKAVARVSHLTHVLAEALAVTADQGGALSLSLAASSFRDATRVAGTEPGLVRAMCENNRDALVTALDETIELLNGARRDLADPDHDISGLVEAGHDARLRYEARAGRSGSGQANRPFILLRPGTPGWLDQLHYAESIGAQIGLLEV